MPYHKTLSRILKSAFSYLKKIPYQKNTIKNLKKVVLFKNLKVTNKKAGLRVY